MSILIKGMEMPKDDMKNIMILADGRVFQFSGYGNPKPLGTVVPVPPHRRLISADEVIEFIENRYEITWKDDYDGGVKDACVDILEKISTMPTVIQEIKEK